MPLDAYEAGSSGVYEVVIKIYGTSSWRERKNRTLSNVEYFTLMGNGIRFKNILWFSDLYLPSALALLASGY